MTFQPTSPDTCNTNAVSFKDHFVCDDLDEAITRMSKAYSSHQITNLSRNKKFRVDHERVVLNQASINTLKYATETRITADPLEDYFLVFFSLKGGLLIETGQEKYRTNPGVVYVVSPEQAVDFRYLEHGVQFNLRVGKKDIEEYIELELVGGLKKPLEFINTPHSLSGPSKSLLGFMQYCSRESNIIGHDMIPVGKHLESTLYSLLLGGVPNNYTEDLEKAPRRPAPNYIHEAMSFMDNNFAEAISIDDIAETCGVSARTLFKGFQNYTGSTPMQYLRNRRLELARSRLTQAGRRNESVTRVALDCGFTHMSRFSRDYSAKYGEKPLHTLRLKKN